MNLRCSQSSLREDMSNLHISQCSANKIVFSYSMHVDRSGVIRVQSWCDLHLGGGQDSLEGFRSSATRTPSRSAHEIPVGPVIQSRLDADISTTCTTLEPHPLNPWVSRILQSSKANTLSGFWSSCELNWILLFLIATSEPSWSRPWYTSPKPPVDIGSLLHESGSKLKLMFLEPRVPRNTMTSAVDWESRYWRKTTLKCN